ncbi:MAG TPA: RNA polymerase sigma factor [Steroidobacteraceae bacterium]|nr:RNA polymerase sigma factor [Steroidobacteraceae bacterium]
MSEIGPTLVERLFAEQRGTLQGFLRRRVRSPTDVADLAQEVYLRLLRVADHTAIRDPVHYLYAVASNLLKEHADAERRRANGVDIDTVPPHEALQTVAEFGGEVDSADRAARLREVLAELSPKCRAAVALRFTYGLSYREAGERLGVSSQMIKKHVAHAIKHCRRRMARMG